MRKEEHVAADPDGSVPSQLHDEMLFGWDPTPGIVSVWATRAGKALVWQRQGGEISCSKVSFRPWLFARTLEDLPPLHAQPPATLPWDLDQSPISYRLLEGSVGSVRTQDTARNVPRKWGMPLAKRAAGGENTSI